MNQRAWHFVNDKLRDGREVPADGVWLEHKGKCVMCSSGLHVSREPFQALEYAPGNRLCLVEVDGVEEEESDKLVCSRRMIVRRIDAEPLMREFARWCALQVIEHWDAPNVVRRYLESGDESLRAAARDAAWAAARDASDATWDATWAAAWAAARDAADAAWAAAWAAARAAAWAAWAATWAAARDATWAAARDAQRERFNRMVYGAFGLDGEIA